MFQICLTLNLIFAVINQCDASEATNALMPLIKGATSHSSTWLQVKNIVPKQKHWVDKLRYDKDPFTTRIRFLQCNGVKDCSSSKQKKKKKGVLDLTPPCTFDAWVISTKWLIKSVPQPGKRYGT